MRLRIGGVGSRLVSPLMRQAGVYTASHLIGRAIPLILLPVLTRFLTPADYGILAMFMLSASVLEPFVGLNLAAAMSVKYFERATHLPSYFGTGILVTLGLAFGALLLVIALQDPLSAVTHVPPAWLLLVIPLIVARVVGVALLTLLRVRGMAFIYGVFQNLQSAALVLLSVTLVVAATFDWRGRVAAELAAWIGFAIVGLGWAVRRGWVDLRFERSYAVHLAGFGAPLILHTLGAVLMVQTDRLLITNLIGVDETGLYTVGYQLALVVEVVAVSFNYAYAPWLFGKLTGADDETKRGLVRSTYLQFAAMTFLAGSVAIFVPQLAGTFLGEGFVGAGRYVAWFALGFLFSAMYYMVTNYVFFAQKTAWLAMVTISVALINIPLTYVLITLNGGIGAAQAMAISLGLSFLLTWVVSQIVYPMPWLSGRLGSGPGSQAT